MNELLPPPEPPRKPFPWKPVSAFGVPAAAFAAAVGVQRLFEGAVPTGDALLRWLVYASVLGLVFGSIAGLAFRRRAVWAMWGFAAPALIAFAVVAAATAIHPVRERIAQARAETCRSEGHKVCSLNTFVSACRGAPAVAASALGPPEQKLCDASGACTWRWTYAGPWLPDNFVEPGSVLCSIVADPKGKGVRANVMPGAPRP